MPFAWEKVNTIGTPLNKIFAHEQFTVDQDRLNLIASFIGVAEKLSFTAAADAAGSKASTLSRRISRLEETLGVRLLNRTTRRVSLTEPGRLYYQECQKILSSISEADAMVSAFNEKPRGLLRISMPVAFGRRHMTATIAKFLACNENIQVEANFTDRFVDLVGEEFDMAIRTGRLQESGLVVRKIAENRRLLVATPEYLARKGTPVVPDDLLQHNCLRYTHYAPAWRLRKDAVTQEVVTNGSFVSDSSEAVYEAILSGLGLGIVAHYMCYDKIRSGELKVVMPDWSDFQAPGIFVAFPSTRYLPPKVRAFTDFLVEEFRTPPWAG